MISLRQASLHRAELRTRMPFRYGITTMTEVPHVFLATKWDIDGRTSSGLASENLPPKWFTKEAEVDPSEEITTMLGVIQEAMQIAAELQPAPDPFSFWLALHEEIAMRANARHLPPLLAGLGTSLVERSLLDAFCRFHSLPLARALSLGRLGVRLEAIHPELVGSSTTQWLPTEPLQEVQVRHTIGLSDPLVEADLTPEIRCADQLPQTLEKSVRIYRLKAFKVKLSGNLESDENRLEAIFATLERCASADWRFSLDGNENFPSSSAFRDYWEHLCKNRWFELSLRRLLFVEQPVRRAEALSPDADWWGWEGAPPIIIDESDGEPSSLRSALELGYRGVSHKNCKGVFRGIANACLIRRRSTPGRSLLMSGEDLANVGPVALLQDLAVQALLGNLSVERNGHHYFRGLSAWPREWGNWMLESHADLYRRHSEGWPTLHIRQGSLDLRSVNAAPFGIGPLLSVEQEFNETTVELK